LRKLQELQEIKINFKALNSSLNKNSDWVWAAACYNYMILQEQANNTSDQNEEII
jgi:hypothetical protein